MEPAPRPPCIGLRPSPGHGAGTPCRSRALRRVGKAGKPAGAADGSRVSAGQAGTELPAVGVSRREARRYPERPIVGVLAVVIREDRVLVVRRANPPMSGRWGFPV